MSNEDTYFDIFPIDADIDINNYLRRPSRKRDFFSPNFYRCLPLGIANTYGFEVVLDTDLTLLWTGDESPASLHFSTTTPSRYLIANNFGHGILSLAPPFLVRTPPLVNTMVLAPVNHPLPHLQVMNAVVETDNLFFSFTLNYKPLENTTVTIQKNTPIATLLPMPRFFQDAFVLRNGVEHYSKDYVSDLFDTFEDHKYIRDLIRMGVRLKDNTYMLGMDIKGRLFKNHQR